MAKLLPLPSYKSGIWMPLRNSTSLESVQEVIKSVFPSVVPCDGRLEAVCWVNAHKFIVYFSVYTCGDGATILECQRYHGECFTFLKVFNKFKRAAMHLLTDATPVHEQPDAPVQEDDIEALLAAAESSEFDDVVLTALQELAELHDQKATREFATRHTKRWLDCVDRALEMQALPLIEREEAQHAHYLLSRLVSCV